MVYSSAFLMPNARNSSMLCMQTGQICLVFKSWGCLWCLSSYSVVSHMSKFWPWEWTFRYRLLPSSDYSHGLEKWVFIITNTQQPMC